MLLRILISAGLVAAGFVWNACSSSGSECQIDGDCPAGRYCQTNSGICAFDCTLDAECPPDYVCTPRGRCERGCARTNGGVEACDWVDNDCDGQTDEDFQDLGAACSNGDCPAGLWLCNADGDGLECDGPMPAPDDSLCDGLDGDCDGQTDEDAVPRACPLQEGVCTGTQEICQGASGWSSCDYGPGYTPDVDATCDQLDEDCDGQTDEDVEPILEAETGGQAADGIDNNCNGLIDEAGGVMVRVPNYETWIDAYEIVISATADCSGPYHGQLADDYPAGWPAVNAPSETLYACSLPGVLPSGHLSWYRAQRACQAQGKILCDEQFYEIACMDGPNRFPYGPGFVPGVCNDAWEGSGQVEPTGSRAQCVSPSGAHDMSGNLAEWVDKLDASYIGNAFVGGYSYLCRLCIYGFSCTNCDFDDPVDRDHIQALSDCNITQGNLMSYPQGTPQAFLGTRCCLQGP